jgi:hypothetical protein
MPHMTYQVKGVRETSENMLSLGKQYSDRIATVSLRSFNFHIIDRMREATYTTFDRQTGLIKSGFGVRTGKLKNNVLVSFGVQQPQAAINMGSIAFKSVARRPRATGKLPPSQWVAFYWRFLELGTNNRTNQRGANRGAISSRSWLQPSFNTAVPSALEGFVKLQRKMVEEVCDRMPKTISGS